jgi:anti-sigma regulatory factor (Ser/Thr protein kinase)
MSTQPRDAGGGQDPTETVVVCDLDGTSSRTFRDLVRQLLGGRSGVAVDDAMLVADELASNAYQHGGAPRVGRLTWFDQGRGLRIEVEDSGAEQPRIRQADATGGRGLLLVDRIARRWGVLRRARCKTVWADVTLAGRPGGEPLTGVG